MHVNNRFPAEWEPHASTWLAWPHNGEDWPHKLESVQWAFAEMARYLSLSERVDILCKNEAHIDLARFQISQQLEALSNDSRMSQCHFHVLNTNRAWLRDSAPTAVVVNNERIEWMGWLFNAWAKYDDFELDRHIQELIAAQTNLPLHPATNKIDGSRIVLEGGAIDTDGEATLLVTEECLLSETQIRNFGMSARDYEDAFCDLLGIERVIWLERGIVGDDTHGHIDDVARFVAPGVVALAVEQNRNDDNYPITQENKKRLLACKDSKGRSLTIIELPLPDPIFFDGIRLPASYANFYIANKCVLVPTFNCHKDRQALATLQNCFPNRLVVGIHATDLVLGRGSIHCLTQQQPTLDR